MSRQLWIALVIELSLMVATVLLLTQPRPLFQLNSPRSKMMTTVTGLVLLSITFCWSVVVGSLATLTDFNLLWQ